MESSRHPARAIWIAPWTEEQYGEPADNHIAHNIIIVERQNNPSESLFLCILPRNFARFPFKSTAAGGFNADEPSLFLNNVFFHIHFLHTVLLVSFVQAP